MTYIQNVILTFSDVQKILGQKKYFLKKMQAYVNRYEYGIENNNGEIISLRSTSLTLLRNYVKEIINLSALIKANLSMIMQLSRHSNGCPFPWTKVRHLCLLLQADPAFFEEANRYCRAHHGHLIWFEGEADQILANRFLDGLIPNGSYYMIGLTHEGQHHKWTSGVRTWYFGHPFDNAELPVFLAKHSTTRVTGVQSRAEKFLCRQ